MRLRVTSFLIGLVMMLQVGLPSAVNSFRQETDPVTESSYSAVEKKLSVFETAALSKIDVSLCDDPVMLELKQAGLLDDYIARVEDNREAIVGRDVQETAERFRGWGISAQETVRQVKNRAQAYLNANYGGVQIGSQEFDDMVYRYVETEEFAAVQMASTVPGFGSLYVYMCLYNAFVSPDRADSQRRNDWKGSKLDNALISDMIKLDCEDNYNQSESRSMARLYVQKATMNNARAVNMWPMLTSCKIEAYAHEFAINYNPGFYVDSSDCTNFVSQCLFIGGLPMNYVTSDEYANGYVEAPSRWFCLSNNTGFGYSVSTAWARVLELYDYLAPHYNTFETKKGSEMTNWLGIGYVMQGRLLWGKYKHAVIITSKNGQLTYCAHTINRIDQELDFFYDSYYEFRAVKVC